MDIAVPGLTIIYLVLSIFPAMIPSRGILFAFFFIYMTFVPGLLVSGMVTPGWRGIPRLISAFIFGFFLISAILLVLALFRLDIRLAKYILTAATILLFSIKRRKRISPVDGPAHSRPEQKGVHRVPEMMILGALLLLVSILILGRGDPVLLSGDSPDHIAYISAVSDSHQAFPEEFYYKDGGILTRDIRKGLVHSFFGLINTLTGHSGVLPVWRLISLFGSLLFILVLYAAGNVLFNSGRAGIIAACLYVLAFRGGLSSYQLANMGTGFSFGRIFYVAAVMMLPGVIKDRRRGPFALFLAASLAATGAHIAHFINLMFISCSACLLYLVTIRRRWRLFSSGSWIYMIPISVLAVNLPYLLMRYFRDYAPANPIHRHVQGVMLITERLFVLNPVVYLQEAGLLGAVSFVALFVLWREAEKVDGLKVLFSAQAAYYMTVFIPFIFTPLHSRLTYLLIRMEFVAPSLIVASYFIDRLMIPGRSPGNTIRARGRIIGWAVVSLAFVLLVRDNVGRFAWSGERYGKALASSSFILDDVYEFINEEMPEGSNILSDPVTSFSIPAFTDQFVVCPYDQHATPNDTSAAKRLADCRKVFSPFVTIDDIAEVMKRYHADHIILDSRIPSSVPTMYWHSDRDANKELASKLDAHPGSFKKIFDHDDAMIYRFEGHSRPPIIEPDPRSPFTGRDLGDDGTASATEGGIEGVFITRFELDRENAARGEMIVAVIGWALDKALPFGSYVTYIRFDSEFDKGVLFSPWYGKVYRKILEKKHGRRYRFRVDRQPFRGLFSPDLWPVGREISDEVTLVIPTDIAPGDYTISLKMATRTQYPNYHLGDILSDDDHYNGHPVGKIRIE